MISLAGSCDHPKASRQYTKPIRILGLREKDGHWAVKNTCPHHMINPVFG